MVITTLAAAFSGCICSASAMFLQKQVDYSEVVSQVSKYSTVSLILALIARNSFGRKSLSIETAFLNAFYDHELYVQHPEGIKILGKEKKKFYRLHRVLFGY